MSGVAITHLMKFNALVYLGGNGLAGSAVRRMESSIVTKGTTAVADGAVTVRTSETGINDKLLETLAIDMLVIPHEGIVPLTIRKQSGITIETLSIISDFRLQIY